MNKQCNVQKQSTRGVLMIDALKIAFLDLYVRKVLFKIFEKYQLFCEYCESFKNTYFGKLLWMGVSKDTCLFQQHLNFKKIERFQSFVFHIISVPWNHISKWKNILSFSKIHVKFSHSTETSFHVFSFCGACLSQVVFRQPLELSFFIQQLYIIVCLICCRSKLICSYYRHLDHFVRLVFR